MTEMEFHLALNAILSAFARGGKFYIKLPNLAISLLSTDPFQRRTSSGFLHMTPSSHEAFGLMRVG